MILIIDSVLKFAIGCLLFVFPFPIMTLSVLLIVVRFITLNFFLKRWFFKDHQLTFVVEITNWPGAK